MARELGLNPKKFGDLADTQQDPWKLPLPQFIEEPYFKRSGQRRPDSVRSIEQIVKDVDEEESGTQGPKRVRAGRPVYTHY